MKKYTLVFALIFYSAIALCQSFNQTRTGTIIFTNWPERWSNLNWQNLVSDDNKYVNSVKLLGGTSWPICFYGYGFTIPSDATINSIKVKMIRFKSGKNNVKDFASTLVTGETESTACGAFPNMANPSYWPAKETAVIYSHNPSGIGTDGKPFQWTPSMVNAPYFGVFFDISFFNGGPGSIAYIEQVEITINYSLPSAKTAESNFINLKQFDNLVTVAAKQSGKYKLTVTDRFGRTLQQNILRNGMNEQVQLNNRCKGFCVITVEGNGQKKSIQTIIY